MKKWIGYGTLGLIGLIILAGVLGGSDNTNTASKNAAPAAVEPPTPEPDVTAQSSYADARDLIGLDFENRVQGVERSSGVVTVGLDAKENLTDGLMKIGMRKDAGNVFQLVYDAAEYRPREVIVQMHMPLTDTTTGKTSDDIVSVYSMTRRGAQRVDWSQADVIDWDHYRTMLHPALR